MRPDISFLDRLRIERFVWTFDSLLDDLPRRSRVEKRREIRQNLLAAASSVGTAQALRQIGSSAQLAQEYLGAEFGDRPRHSWMAAGLFAASVTLVATSLWTEAALAFGDGIRPPTPKRQARTPGTVSRIYRTASPTPSPTATGLTSAVASPRCSGLSGSGGPWSSDGCGG